MEKRDYKKDVITDLELARSKYNCNVTLVEANPEKGFNYSYLVYIPENPSTIMVMDCLNDYEAPLSLGETENLSAIEEVYSAFGDKRASASMKQTDGKTEENKDKSLDRLYYRIAKGFDALSNLIGKNFNAPAIVPLIPGYGNEGFSNVASQLDRDRVVEIAPQIEAIIKDAKMIVEKSKSGIRLNDKIICYGNQKVQKVASFCGGGASHALDFVLTSKTTADTIVTSDMPHHVLKELIEKDKNVIIIPHYASEDYGFKKFYEYVKEKKDEKLKVFYFEDRRFK